MDAAYKAILIGNNEFPDDPHGLPKLNGPVNDVKILKKALCDPDKGLFEEKNIITLLNANSIEILSALEQFFQNLKRTDQSLFYYSGHGLQDRMNRLYLCAKNSKKDSLISTTISDNALNMLLEASQTRKHILIFDCCHSGGFKGGDLPQSLQGEGRFVITSSTSEELTTDTDNPDAPSPFTKYLHEALLSDGIDQNQDGYVSVNEVYEYIFPRIYKETKQRPQRKFGDTSGDLPLCKRKVLVQSTLGGEKVEHKTMNLGFGKPKLNVSEQRIEHLAVHCEEKLLDEIIDVFNEGSGELDWVASCDSDWVTIEPHDTYIKLKLAPNPGMNRASIRVKDKSGGGSKTIRVTVQKLKAAEPKLDTEKENELNGQSDLNDDFATATTKFLVFKDVKMRHLNQAKAVVDNSEQPGVLEVFSDRIEFVGEVKTTIKNIDVLDYYPQEINPGYTFNYMGISGDYDGVKKMMYFYVFSWFGAGQTWKMAEQIYDLIKTKKLPVEPNFTTHINNPPNQHSNTQSSENHEIPPKQNNIYMPGAWNIYIYQFGQQIAYLNLYFNVGGALSGTQQSADGFSQISGTWGYNPQARILTYSVMVSHFTGTIPNSGSVSLQMDADGSISGTDLLGRYWTLQKTGN